jgi:site-specific recombinase XerD
MQNKVLILPAIARYIRFLQSEENKCPRTIQTYQSAFNLFLRLCPVTAVSDLTKETVREFKIQLHEYRTSKGKELSIASKRQRLVVIRSFLRYLQIQEELPVCAPEHVKLIKNIDRQVKFLNKEEMYDILKATDFAKKVGIRDRAILALFLSTGLRRAELASLNRPDINLRTREISIRGKGNRVRVVFISDRAARALEEYLEIRKDSLLPLFIRGLDQVRHLPPPGHFYRLTPNAICALVKKYGERAGIICKPTCHTLRHSFATDLLRNGADIRSVQEMLGHRNLNTTQIYTHVTNPQLKEIHRKYHGVR